MDKFTSEQINIIYATAGQLMAGYVASGRYVSDETIADCINQAMKMYMKLWSAVVEAKQQEQDNNKG